MAAGSGFTVNADELDGHASHLDQLCGNVGTAKSAGDAVRLGANAYGPLCAAVPVFLGALQGILMDAMEDAIQSLKHNGEQLKVMANQYREAEQQHQEQFRRIHSALRTNR